MNVLELNPQNIHNFDSVIKNRCIILFHHPQCDHCKELRPTWERMKYVNKDKPLNIMEINHEMLNALNHPIKHSVKGFPQIIKLENGKVMEEFNQPRSLENLNHFVNNSSNDPFNKLKKNKTQKKKKPKAKKYKAKRARKSKRKKLI